jgi:hypothetical protein
MKTIEHIKSSVIPPVIATSIPETTLSYLEPKYEGSNISSFPYTLEITIVNSLSDYREITLFETSITSSFKIYHLIPLDDIFQTHLNMIATLQSALHENCDHPLFETYKIPVPLKSAVETWIKESNLMARLITGLSLN